MSNLVNYTRVVLKLSGEALKLGDDIISNNKVQHFCEQIQYLVSLNIGVVVIIGGGNLLRGATTNLNTNRFKADNMGMLATLINSIAVQDALEKMSIKSVVLNSFEANKVAEYYTSENANKYLQDNTVVICSGGVANPYFSTDTCAVLRALETNCDVILKGTQVDGVYDSDPKQNQNAKKFSTISYNDVIEKNLKIMDLTAIIMAKNNNLPIIIFDIHKKDSIKQILTNINFGSIIK
jgi:uridylate kinase